jgi:hypothetical protein
MIKKSKMSIFLTLMKHFAKALTSAKERRREREKPQSLKELIVSLFANGNVVYIENLKNYTHPRIVSKVTRHYANV